MLHISNIKKCLRNGDENEKDIDASQGGWVLYARRI